MSALLTAILSFGGGEIIARLGDALLSRLLGSKAKGVADIATTVQDIGAPGMAERIAPAGKKAITTLRAKWLERMGREITSDEIVAVQEALED